MTKIHHRLIAAACLLALAAPALAETHEETLKSDQTQQQYTRKSITFFGTILDSGVSMPDDVKQAVTGALRKGIELKRFDYNNVDPSGFGSMEAFLQALREYVKKRSFDRAAADAEWQDKFSSARVYQEDIERVMGSAYLYQIRMTVYRSKPMICPADAKTAARLECTPGVAGIQATVNAEVDFYRAELKDEQGKGYTKIRTLKELPGKGFTPFDVQPPPEPRRPQLPANASDAQKRDMAEKFESAMQAYRQARAEYERQLPELDRKTRVKAAIAAVGGGGGLFGAAGLVNRLSTAMKTIPDFQLKTPVTAALSDGVEFMLGKDEGLELDDTYEVAEFGTGGDKMRSGWVKVRKIGAAKGSGEGTPSYAEQVSVSRSFVGGEQLFEYPMLKLDIGLHGVFEFTTADLLDPSSDDFGLYGGGGLYMLYDLGPAVGWPDFWVGLEADFLVVGTKQNSSGEDETISLIHAMIGLKKRWYVNSLVLTIGLRGGISYYTGENKNSSGEDQIAIGGGADLVLGAEYYVHPRFSVYLNAAGRFFTNPLLFDSLDAENEMGAQAALGIRLGL